MLTLYSDRHSHVVRACLLFLKNNDVDFKEEPIVLFKGEHLNHPALLTKTVPTLTYEQPGQEKITICQSTTILRFLGANFAKDDSWYSNPKIRYVIDEYFDYFQSVVNPALMKGVANRVFYRLKFNLSEPNQKLIDEGMEEFKKDSSFRRKKVFPWTTFHWRR